jgi:hypothetical protein
MKLDRLLLIVVVVAVAILAGIALADHCSEGRGTLAGPELNGAMPEGKAEWRGNDFCQPLEMKVEVSKVRLADGTELTVDACGSGGAPNPIGIIRLKGGSGKLELSKLDGDPNNDDVPFCDVRFGGVVKVLHGGSVILSGCVSSSDIPGAPEC